MRTSARELILVAMGLISKHAKSHKSQAWWGMSVILIQRAEAGGW